MNRATRTGNSSLMPNKSSTQTTVPPTTREPTESEKLDMYCGKLDLKGFIPFSIQRKGNQYYASIICDEKNGYYSSPLPKFTQSTNKFTIAKCSKATNHKYIQECVNTQCALNCQTGSPTKYNSDVTHMLSEECITISDLPLRYGSCSIKCKPGYYTAEISYATSELKTSWYWTDDRQAPAPGKIPKMSCANGCTRPGSDANPMRNAFGHHPMSTQIGCITPSTALCNDLTSSYNAVCDEELGYFALPLSTDEDVSQMCSYGKQVTEPYMLCEQGCRPLPYNAYYGYALKCLSEIANGWYRSCTFSCINGYVRTNRGEFGAVTSLYCRLGQYSQSNVRFLCKLECSSNQDCSNGLKCQGINDAGKQFCNDRPENNSLGYVIKEAK